jgi:hypothetical protein
LGQSEVERQGSRSSASIDDKMPILDTLKLARRLEDAGFTSQQATGAAEALSALVFPDVVTKADLQTDIAQLRAELRMEIANLKTAVAQ